MNDLFTEKKQTIIMTRKFRVGLYFGSSLSVLSNLLFYFVTLLFFHDHAVDYLITLFLFLMCFLDHITISLHFEYLLQ